MLIGPAPIRHSVDNGVHGFAQLTQRIFHARRHFRINRAHNNAVLFQQRRLSVSTFWLIPSKSFFSSLKRQVRICRLRIIKSFHLLPIKATVVATGQAGLDTWKDYVKSLGKPMNDIFIVCHPAGASYIKGMNVYGTEGAQKSIVSGSTGATTQGLFAAFGADFHGGDDTAAITDTVSGKVQLAGVDFEVIDRGESYDLAIPSMNVVYTHMLGKTTHSILTSAAHIEAFLQMLKEYQAAGYAMILTSHGGSEGQDAVAEKISYLNKTKEIMQQSKTADEFKANMKAAFPAYNGENYLDMTTGFLYK